jgi:hypothetical protein
MTIITGGPIGTGYSYSALTLGDLKAEIASDFARSDLTDEIAAAINRAIEFYAATRFFFNETRDATFDTVDGQARYNSVESDDIPNFITLDSVFITVAGHNRQMRYISPEEFEWLTDSSASEGEPYSYTYFNTEFGFYPIPDDEYEIRLTGHINIPAPGSDDETDNAWMIYAYQLIRSRASSEIALKKVRDFEFAAAMRLAEKEELSRLQAETGKRIATGRIEATCF